MSRTKGSKNKPKHDFLSLSNNNAGNPAFNLKDAIPVGAVAKVKDGPWLDKDAAIATGAILPEDMELERSLQAMTNDLPILDDDDPTVGVVKKTIEKREMLGDVVADYKPAATHAELQEQTAMAVAEGCDSIELTVALAKKICRDPQLEEVGYFMYRGIKAYLVGAFERVVARDRISIEQRMFGKSTEVERQEALRAQIKNLEKQLHEH